MTTPRERIAKALAGAVMELEALGFTTTTVLEPGNTGHLKWRTRGAPACFCPDCGKQVAVIDLAFGRDYDQKWICCDKEGNRVHTWFAIYSEKGFTLKRGDPNE